MRIFLVEDHPIDRKLIRAVLENEGCVLHEMTALAGAFEAICDHTPDVVLLDMQLPDDTGLTLLRKIRASDRTCAIPVVAVTAYPNRYRPNDILSAGCDACLIKPLDTRTLAADLRRVLR